MTEKQVELNVTEEPQELSPKEKKKLENYSRSMITRGEAYNLSRSVAVEEVGQLANFLRDPLRANMVQSMAIIELLTDKGIIESDDHFQIYLDRVADKVQAEAEKEGEASGEQEGIKIDSESEVNIEGNTYSPEEKED